uniref:Heterokaryon incompatibility domain-containing protein n=2 Tax=Bionectria ochroleuca TaxID=29856 RepID=A0A8H7K9P2_BIOOC
MACASDDPQGSLFRNRDTTDPTLMPGIVPQPILATEKGNHFIFDKEFWNKQVRYGSLYNRGWIFQERLLAPRVLYFTEDQVMWECLCETRCETFPEGIPYNRSLRKLDVLWHENNPDDNSVQRDMILLIAWNKLVKEYS